MKQGSPYKRPLQSWRRNCTLRQQHPAAGLLLLLLLPQHATID